MDRSLRPVKMECRMTIQERKAIPIPQVEPRKPIPQQNLRIPGPTPVPAKVLKEMAQPMINHRGPEFAAILRRGTPPLQNFFPTALPALTYPTPRPGRAVSKQNFKHRRASPAGLTKATAEVHST